MGPIGSFAPPNITSGGIGKEYSDGEMARLLLSGIKRDGTSATFMPSADFRWWPDEDVVALDAQHHVRRYGQVFARGLPFLGQDSSAKMKEHGSYRPKYRVARLLIRGRDHG